ncbi:MAG TPA: hypothetical protein VMF52_02185 [Steroidobacteraceae bacterium]|nr:hypothetical protein [Steroidobacteraceae bacterium]
MKLHSSMLMAGIVAASLITGCATSKTAPKQPAARPEAAPAKPQSLGKQRQMLSEGYSMLYHDAGTLDLSELILYVKLESDSMHAVVTAISSYGDELKKDLEKIARDYPGVRIDLQPLPEIELRKRKAIAKDRMKDFAPVVGKGGREYERTILLSFANGLNHERHLCAVMADAEPDANLKKFLLDSEKRFDGLYERVTGLLEKDYFKAP